MEHLAQAVEPPTIQSVLERWKPANCSVCGTRGIAAVSSLIFAKILAYIYILLPLVQISIQTQQGHFPAKCGGPIRREPRRHRYHLCHGFIASSCSMDRLHIPALPVLQPLRSSASCPAEMKAQRSQGKLAAAARPSQVYPRTRRSPPILRPGQATRSQAQSHSRPAARETS